MTKLMIFCFVALLACTTAARAEKLTIGAGAAPTENILKPVETPFENATGIDLSIFASGPRQAFIDLERGTIDAAAAGLSFKDWLVLMQNEGVAIVNPEAYQPVVIGQDKVVVIVHKENPVTGLDKQQLKGIFSRKITNWKEVGGKDTPILVIWGEFIQGTNFMFVKNIMDDAPLTSERVEATTAEDIRAYVATNPEAIGIGPQAIVDASVHSPQTPEIVRPITLITKGAASRQVTTLINFIKGAGRKYIKE